MSCIYHLVLCGILHGFLSNCCYGMGTEQSDCLVLRKSPSQSYKPNKIIQATKWLSSSVSEDHKKPKRLWTLPVMPDNVRLDSSDWNQVTVYWTPGRLLNLKYFMLKVSEERENTEKRMAYTISYYVLVNVSDHKIKKRGMNSLGYSCINPGHDTVRLYVRVWALAGVAIKDKLLTFKALDDTLRQSNEVNGDLFRSRQEINNCICQTKVEPRLYYQPDPLAVYGKIIIRGNISHVSFRSTLFCNDEVVKTSVNDLSIHLGRNKVQHGAYVLQVELLCQRAEETTCGRVQSVPVQSHKLRIPRNLFHVVSVDKPLPRITIKGPSQEPLQGASNDLYIVVKTVLITCSILTLVVAVVATVTRFFLKFDTGIRQSKFCTYLRSHRIAVLYTPESEDRHAAMVNAFAKALSKSGLSATPIDDVHRRGLSENWIDEGETIVREFDEIVFVVSPTMKHVCRRRISPRAGTSHDTRDIETADMDVLYNRLPAVVINSWKCKLLAREETEPGVHTVILNQKTTDTKQLAQEFCAEHRSVFTNSTVYISPSSYSDFHHNKEFQKLISKIKHRRCFV